MPKISVIIPVYKVDEYLAECLNSVRVSSLDDIEIIVVDEGEEDDCKKIIDEFKRELFING